MLTVSLGAKKWKNGGMHDDKIVEMTQLAQNELFWRIFWEQDAFTRLEFD